MSAPKNKMRKVHPGEIILMDYLIPYFLVDTSFAILTIFRAERISTVLESIVLHKKPIDKKAAKLLSNLFNTTPEFWLNLQKAYDQA